MRCRLSGACIFAFTSPFRWLLSAGLCFALAGLAAPAQTPPSASVHIELTVSRWPTDSDRSLSPRNFVLSQGGQRLSFHLTRPEDKPQEPVHVLLFSAKEPAGFLWSAAGPGLSKAWERGWLVSIVGSDRVTPYVASAAELGTSLQSAAPAGTPGSEQPLRQLAIFAGRRVIVLADTSGLTPLLSHTVPEIYMVDGGILTGHTFDPVYLFGPCNYAGTTGIASAAGCGGDTPYSFQGNPELSPAIETQDRDNGFRRGIWHGKTLSAAVNQMFHESRRYFDLEADVPAAALRETFDLQFRKLPGGLRLRAEAYAENAGLRSAEPRLVLSQR